ncbi:non-structural maintenance of chromosomes element 4 homolog A-like [Styela clava]|uniref:non-structural maintenance of chromosomes element 4 homolog A-like n=1 Tax=Styela clava TaxID=7725 RepID=UPI00193A1528|nr:non-structural maintenance of chromosomes element 4 homolog A-like [Styela clava]
MAENGDEEMEISSLSSKFMTPIQRAERLKIRQEYRKLISEVQDKKEEFVKPESGDLLDRVKKANSLFQRVKSTREGALDSRFMALSVSIAGQTTNQLQTDLVAFQPEEFMEKLVTRMDGRYIGEEEDEVHITSEGWENFGQYSSKFFSSVNPVLNVMSGTFEHSALRRRHTQSDPIDNDTGTKTQPQHLTHFEGDRKEATPEEIERVLGVIQQMYEQDPVPIDYFELVVNPDSFGHTIENMFHMAFLVKDGFVRVFLNENQIPVVEPVNQNEEDNTQTEKKCNQVMVSMSMDEWREIIDIYELGGRAPFIEPSEPKSPERANGPSSKRVRS